MVIVCWTTDEAKDHGYFHDHWQSFHDLQAARDFYRELLNDNITYTASICGVIDSTDYEPYDCAQKL